MSKHRTSMFRYRTVRPLLVSSPVSDRNISLDHSQPAVNTNQQVFNEQQISKNCHHHSSTNENEYRNNHSSDLIHLNEISKSSNSITRRKRQTRKKDNENESCEQSNEKPSLLQIYVNNTLLILIRLMILVIIIFIISFIFYYSIVHIYPKPKKSEWEQIIDWFTLE
ncbi:unnamed protein product [Rotaria socialis]|uniref:Uncharacterized protein n=1 Tax=Rotaria socialis TaxID=392032 RepID=A0A817XXX9_9BILA|nr:unnamed protein product [Rotaria socialis]CAF4566007.1 unnamed protein product [Rotaria socialis]